MTYNVFSGTLNLTQIDRQTDGQTDRQLLITIPRLHSCSAVKTTNITYVYSVYSTHSDNVEII